MKTATNHFSILQYYQRGQEVVFNGEEYICSLPKYQYSCTGIAPYDVRFWQKKNQKEVCELDRRIELIHKNFCRLKQDHQLLLTLLEREQTQEHYYKVNSEEMFNRQKN